MKQLIRWKRGRRISLAVTALVAAGALGASGAAQAVVTGTVTSVTGEASVGENPAELSGVVSEGDSIVTGPEAACSVLVDKRSLVQFCGQAVVRLRHDEARNATILDVTEGSTRALVGTRPPDEPLEIHTPVAIAAILGTIVSVTVDPLTGDTTFALEEGEVRIEVRDPARTIILHAGEQVTIHAGALDAEVQRLRLQDVAKRAECLDDRFFHGASLDIARIERAEAATDVITAADIPYAGLPPVAAPPEPEFDPPTFEDPPGTDDPCGLTLCEIPLDGDVEPPPDDFEPPPPDRRTTPPAPCSPIPGEYCIPGGP